MLDDAKLRDAVAYDIACESAPAVNLQAIHAKITGNRAAARPMRVGRAALAAAAMAVVALAFAPNAGAVVQSMEAKFDAALRAMGIQPGPPIPSDLIQSMRSHQYRANIAQIQPHVNFTIVPPAGVPSDVRSEKIISSPTGVYSAKTHAWSLAAPVVVFRYTRANNQTFTLMAQAYDRHERISAYMFRPVEDKHGNPVITHGRLTLQRFNAYAWRNGNQVMHAVAGDGISDSEVAAIRTAMGGIALRGVKTKLPRAGKRIFVVNP